MVRLLSTSWSHGAPSFRVGVLAELLVVEVKTECYDMDARRDQSSRVAIRGNPRYRQIRK